MVVLQRAAFALRYAFQSKLIGSPYLQVLNKKGKLATLHFLLLQTPLLVADPRNGVCIYTQILTAHK